MNNKNGQFQGVASNQQWNGQFQGVASYEK